MKDFSRSRIPMCSLVSISLVHARISPQSRKGRQEVFFYLAACLREAASAKAGERPLNKKASVA
jgi:hypothetical protein